MRRHHIILVLVVVALASAFTVQQANTTNTTPPPKENLPPVVPINYGAAQAVVDQVLSDRYLTAVSYATALAKAEAEEEAEAQAAAARAQAEAQAQQAEAQATSSAPTPNPAPAPAPAPARSGGSSVWDTLAQCESGGNWSYPPVGGGFSGGIMFHIGTWRAMGGTAYAPDAYLATREQQIAIAEKVLASSGWGAWPGCSSRLGLR